MKVFISADIEGVGGVATWDQAATDRADYARAREWMTEEVNAATEGAIEGGASEIVVRDAHGRARNILWEKLHPRARLISGWDPTADMLLGLDDSYGAVLLIGYHPGPAIERGVLSHTFASRILDMRLNGMPCNETVIAALQAGALGIPIALVTGQAELETEIRPALPDVPFVATKRGLGYQAALLEPMADVRQRIRGAALSAVRRAREESSGSGRSGIAPFRPSTPLRLEIDLTTHEAALAIREIEGIERGRDRTTVLTAPDAAALLRRFFTVLQLLYATKDTP